MYAVLSRKICFKIENLFIKFKNNLYDEKITYMMRKLYIIYIYIFKFVSHRGKALEIYVSRSISKLLPFPVSF